MRFILHSYRRCPFCIRTRILLSLKKIPYEIVEEPLRVWTPWMKKWSEENNERARVPVLRCIDQCGAEKAIPESNEINLFLDALDDSPTYTPNKESTQYTELLQWFTWCDTKIKPVIDLYKYGENLEFDIEKHKLHTDELQNLVQVLEDTLKDKKYLIEEKLTLADIAVIPFIRQIMRTREGEFDFTPYPHVSVWTRTIIESEWFKDEIMKSHV